MNISTENQVMIFRKEYNGNVFYSLSLSKKKQDGSYQNGYMPCQFKKGVELKNQTKIYIKKAWLSFYLKDIPNSEKKQTVPYIFINEFVTIEEAIDKAKVEVKEEIKEDPYVEIAQELNSSELPF